MTRVRILAALIVILFAALALRLHNLPAESIWWDEGHSIFVASHSLAAIPTVPAMDVHPPLYFWLLHVWMGVGGRSEFALRFLSLWFGVVTVALMYRLGRGWLSVGGGLLAAAVATLSPLYLAHSQEVRMYALVSALSALSLYAFGSYLFPKSTGRRAALVLYVLSTAAALYSHYFVGFLIVFQNLFWFGRLLLAGGSRRIEEWARWVAAQVAILVLMAPQIYTMTRQVGSYKNPNLLAPLPGEYLRQLWASFVLGGPDPSGVARFWLPAVAGVLALGLLAAFLPRRNRAMEPRLLLLGACVGVPLALYYAVLQDRASFSPRYMMVVTPALYLLLAFAVQQLGRRWLPFGLIAGAVVALAFGSAGYAYFAEPIKDDTRGLARWLEREATERDAVFIDVPHPLDYYYHGAAPASYLFVDIHTVADVLTKACDNRERVFWVRWRQSDTDPRGAVTFLLDKYGVRRGEKRFPGYDVVWYDLPKPVRFSLPTELDPLQVSFAGQLSLTGRAFGGAADGAVRAGSSAWAVLAWRSETPGDRDLRVGVYLLDAGGRLIGQDDRDLLNDRHLRSRYWTAGEAAINVYTIPVPPGTPPGAYTLAAGVYAAEEENFPPVPLNVLDVRGAPLGTTALLGTVHVARPDAPPDVAAVQMANRLDRPFGEDLLLSGYDLAADRVGSGGALSLSMYWVARRAVTADYLVGVALKGDDGTTDVERRARPANGTYSTSGWAPGEVVCDRIDLPVPAEVRPGRYTLRVALMRSGSDDPVAEETLAEIEVTGRARLFEIPAIERPLSADFDGRIELLGYDATPERDAIALTLYWRALRGDLPGYKVFTHLLDAEQRIRGQIDSVPGAGALPTSGWAMGEVIADRYTIPVQAGIGPALLDLEFGFYDPLTGGRLPVRDASGAVTGDHVLVPGVYRVQ